LVEKELRVKARYNKPGTCQRNAIHWASRTDSEEAYLCGQEAVRLAAAGRSGSMVTLVREGSKPYRSATGLAGLEEIANRVKPLPREYMDQHGTSVTPAFREYATPLVQGKVPVPVATDGLPSFVRFERRGVPPKLAAWRQP
jgi:ATP-dependent phosphofructokinase / diphosphate-dependent phosphofructokinase